MQEQKKQNKEIPLPYQIRFGLITFIHLWPEGAEMGLCLCLVQVIKRENKITTLNPLILSFPMGRFFSQNTVTDFLDS